MKDNGDRDVAGVSGSRCLTRLHGNIPLRRMGSEEPVSEWRSPKTYRGYAGRYDPGGERGRKGNGVYGHARM